MAKQILVVGLQDIPGNGILEEYFNTFGDVEEVKIGLDDQNGITSMISFKDDVTIPLVMAVTDHQIGGIPVTILTADMMEVNDEPAAETKAAELNEKALHEIRELEVQLKNKRQAFEIEEKRLNAKKM